MPTAWGASMTAFELIPVIDLMGGVVVHARAGQRDQLRPLQVRAVAPAPSRRRWSRACWLCIRSARSTSPISTRSESRATTRPRSSRCARAFPELRLWVDAGFAGECSCRRFLGADLGSRCSAARARPTCGCSSCWRASRELVLSLDFMGDRPLGAGGDLRHAGALARARHRHDPGAGGQRRRSRSRAAA